VGTLRYRPLEDYMYHLVHPKSSQTVSFSNRSSWRQLKPLAKIVRRNLTPFLKLVRVRVHEPDGALHRLPTNLLDMIRKDRSI
jgi:hypothetical protein